MLRRASSGLQHHASVVSRGAQALLRALPLSGGGAASALAARARRAAQVGVGPCPLEGHFTSERHLSLGVRPCSDVPNAASNAKQAPRVAGRRRYCALSFSREEAQHAHLRRARAAPRWLESDHALWKVSTPAKRLCLSTYGRAPTCAMRPPTPSKRRRVSRGAGANARSLSLGRRRSTRTCGARARAARVVVAA